MKYNPEVDTRTKRRYVAALRILRVVTVRIENTTIIAANRINII
jgi:hypothetical protein